MSITEYFKHGLMEPHSEIENIANAIALDPANNCRFVLYRSRNLGSYYQVWMVAFLHRRDRTGDGLKLQPLVGAFDILMAILLLKGANRAILIWMFLWALWTAILRPSLVTWKKFRLKENGWFS